MFRRLALVALLCGLSVPHGVWGGEPAKTHWAFQPLGKHVPPAVEEAGRNAVDRFIRAKQVAQGITPSSEAGARVLIRRAYLDLTGLPPTPDEVDAFEKDKDPKAYEKLVERLLASPQYGERWGRHWLDVARWAESEGYESNHLRPFAWRYRDWVVKAFNDDMPFARFIEAQIAGDEMAPYADENLIATGFLAAARLSSNEEDRWRQKNDIYVDIVNTTGSAFLGLTLQCAQCHDHRFDPISIRDYYRFMGFFAKGQPGNLALKDKELWTQYEAKKPEDYDRLLKERDSLFETARQRRLAEVRKGLPRETLAILELPRHKRSLGQERIFREADLLFQFTAGGIEAALKPDERKIYNDAKKKVEDFEKEMLPPPQTFAFYSPITSPHALEVLPMKGFYPLAYLPEELKEARPFLLDRGDVHRPKTELDVGWPAVFASTSPPLPRHGGEGPGLRDTRTELAHWLAAQPLVARVYVNRIWQWHFGRGIVSTSGDFGLKGAAPTHPELLDWLAAEFLRKGGSTKELHRLIVLSSTYRQAAARSESNEKADPDNLTWWRWQPRRLEAEAIRDSLLAVTGELDKSVGGPSGPDKLLRRSLYLVQKRDLPPVFQPLFDGPSAMTESCSRRQVTTVPLQALFLLNNPFVQDRARALAAKVRAEAATERSKQIEAAFRLTLGRSPDDRERKLSMTFFESASEAGRSLEHFCHALLNVNEFVFID